MPGLTRYEWQRQDSWLPGTAGMWRPQPSQLSSTWGTSFQRTQGQTDTSDDILKNSKQHMKQANNNITVHEDHNSDMQTLLIDATVNWYEVMDSYGRDNNKQNIPFITKWQREKKTNNREHQQSPALKK